MLSPLTLLENSPSCRAVRNGFVMIIPLVLVGSFSLLLNTLPMPSYQSFIINYGDGIIKTLLSLLYAATSGMFSVYLTATISLCYVREHPELVKYTSAAIVTALITFFVLAGMHGHNFSRATLGAQGVFLAMLSAIAAPALLMRFLRLCRRYHLMLRARSVDAEFNSALDVLLPVLLTVASALGFFLVLCLLFSVDNLQEMFINAASWIFLHMPRGFFSGLCFVFFSVFFWFFGIHGNNVLEGVSARLFEPPLADNIVMSISGGQPHEIVSKAFLDVFTISGGTGCTLSLLIALLLFSKNRPSLSLCRVAALPVCFNINELLTFGLPIVFNPIFFAPFLLTPVVSYCLAYAATAAGLVPIICTAVQWTTPVFFSGWVATGSPTGPLLQLLTLTISVAIYKPFIHMYDAALRRGSSDRLNALVNLLQKSEDDNKEVHLSMLTDARGSLARVLTDDLQAAMASGGLGIYYQPQHNAKDVCVGVEALLRWHHPAVGFIYPPLIIKLAEENGLLEALERTIILHVVREIPQVRKEFGADIKISANVTGRTIQNIRFTEFLEGLVRNKRIKAGDLWLEVTEQSAFLGGRTEEIFTRLRACGYRMIIDDFSMGHTSLKYLQQHQFDMLKLDGSLVRDIADNERTRNIVASIVHLAHSLNFSVLAEFVETREQQRILEALGCQLYQGYLYGKARPVGLVAPQA